MNFEFATAGRIPFGPGVLKQIAPWLPRKDDTRCSSQAGQPKRPRPLMIITLVGAQTPSCQYWPSAL